MSVTDGCIAAVKAPWKHVSATIFNKNSSDAVKPNNKQKLAAHAFLYSETSVVLFDEIPMKFSIMMQLRFDGKFGFPGGLIGENEIPVDGLNRELTEEIGLQQKYHFQEDNYVCSWAQGGVIDHFFIKKYTEKDFKIIESNILLAKDWGGETLGIIRVPLHELMHSSKAHPFVSFLSHNFVANAQEELIHSILHEGIYTEAEMMKFWRLYLKQKTEKF